MKKRHVLVLFAALVLGGGWLGAAPARAASPAFGTQFHCTWGAYTDQQRVEVIDRLKWAGVKWVRIDMGWDAFEYERYKISGWHVDLADRCVDLARSRGINVLGVLHRTPGWANGNRGPTVPPYDSGDYGWIAGWVAQHFRGRVSAWQMWNEPSNPDAGSWDGDVNQYVSLIRAAYPALKSGDPNALVLFANGAYQDDRFLRRAYEVGAKGYFDAVATHPYQGQGDLPPETPDNGTIWRISHLPAVRQVMVDWGDAGKPIWFTEFGWTVHDNWPGIDYWQLGVTGEQQADYLVRMIRYTRDNFPYVPVMIWYKERAWTGEEAHWAGYALLDSELRPRVAYWWLQWYYTYSGQAG
ncbi:MAG: cellulase family glycosylhydrolase [Actinobacteria bacterium]|nr:cellulase family glycosylhydrolase [Actinomycetota bacterium]